MGGGRSHPSMDLAQEGVNYSVLQGDSRGQLVAGPNIIEFGFSLLVAGCWRGSSRSLTVIWGLLTGATRFSLACSGQAGCGFFSWLKVQLEHRNHTGWQNVKPMCWGPESELYWGVPWSWSGSHRRADHLLETGG